MSISHATSTENLHIPQPPPSLSVRPQRRPSPGACAERIALASVEIVRGYRNVRQIQQWVSPEIYEMLARRFGLARRIGAISKYPSRVMRSRVFFPSSTACEASVIVHDSQRPRACALRLEVHRGRWRALALDIV